MTRCGTGVFARAKKGLSRTSLATVVLVVFATGGYPQTPATNGGRQGDIFTPAISVEFRKVLSPGVNAMTRAVILDDNPGGFSHRINGTYPKDKSLSTVPANILAVLPRLPDDIQYRFVGRHLVLLDTRGNVILDRLPCAIRCKDWDELSGNR